MATLFRAPHPLRGVALVSALALAFAAGSLTVLRADALPPVIDLSSTNAPLTVYGGNASDFLGHSVATGDINGDGRDDLIVAAFEAETPGGIGAGKVYVFYDSASIGPIFDLHTANADLTVYGDDYGDSAGWSVAAGDINGDGVDDLIIGAPYGGYISPGKTYVIYGSASLPSVIDLNSTSADLTVVGAEAGDESGWSVAAGDISGDGVDDLIIGAWPGSGPVNLTPVVGNTYVIYGGPNLPSTIDLGTMSADLSVYGRDAGEESGLSVAAGDINGDSIDDLIIGAPFAAPGGRIGAGTTYVIYGGASLPTLIDLAFTSADLEVYGDGVESTLGISVAAGDINGDSIADLIIGASFFSSLGAGGVYAIYGGPSLSSTIDLSTTNANVAVVGKNSRDRTGNAVAVGDLNADGIGDLIIGAPGAKPAGQEVGETYAIDGDVALPTSVDLSSTNPALAVLGDELADEAGYAVAAGDINGDGSDDLIIGAHQAAPAGRRLAGEVYVIYGDPPPTRTPTQTPGISLGGVALYPPVPSKGPSNEILAAMAAVFALMLGVGVVSLRRGLLK